MRINDETKIGLMVVAVIAILIGMTIKTGNLQFSQEGYHINVRFSDIDGVNLNSPVMFNGYEVGIVKDIRIIEVADEIQMELKVWMKEEARLKKGTKAYVKNLGFMGEKYVGLVAGPASREYLKDGVTIQGEDPPDFGVLFAQTQDVIGQVKGITENLNERLEVNKYVVDDILANANETMENISDISANTSDRLAVNEQKIDSIVTNLERLSVNFKELSHDLKLHPWKLLYRGKTKEKE
jgi:phospholipid/cholesterol/gamma-HCH transport system substrate-binding protein